MLDFDEAYVLHRRHYHETSSLVEFWVRDAGLLKVIVKGVHGSGKDAAQRNAWLQPFQRLGIQIYGQRDLRQVYKFEPYELKYTFSPNVLMAGHYANELALFALRKYDPEVELFDIYIHLLHDLRAQCHLGSGREVAKILRCFEQNLLDSLGFSVDWFANHQQAPIDPALSYLFKPGEGFQESCSGLEGRLINAVAVADWQVEGALSVARQVLRQQLEWCFGQPLRVPSAMGNP